MTEFLYGLDGDEYMCDSPAEVYEGREDDHCFEDVPIAEWKPMKIEEWTSLPLGHFVPSALKMIEDLVEGLGEDVSEGAYDSIGDIDEDPGVRAAFEAARAAFISKLGGWRQAQKLVRTPTVTWDENGDPLLDGEPMYVKRTEIPGQTELEL